MWTLQFNLAFNSGMAFSRGRGMGPYIAVVATARDRVAAGVVAQRRDEARQRSGWGCLIGGAAGNLIDRMFRGDAWLRGSVVDFIDFQWFPIFNVADIAVNVGAGLLILNSILVSRSERDADPGDADEGSGAMSSTTNGESLLDESAPSDPDGHDYRKESR